MGLGPSLPPAELARRNSALFMEVKRLFFTTPEAEILSKPSWIETEANGDHRGDRTLNRTRPVSGSGSQARVARVLHQCDRSLAGPARPVRCQRDREREGSIGRGSVSGHDRPDASGRGWVLTGIDWMLALWRPISLSDASSHAPQRASLWRPDARAHPISFDRRVRSL
jgi:hypothetical protein